MSRKRRAVVAMMLAQAAILLMRPGTALSDESCPNQQTPSAGSTADFECVDCVTPPLYEKRATLQETLLATRDRYFTWSVQQPAARETVEFGTWLATPLLPSADTGKQIRPAEDVDPNAKLADGRSLWSQRSDLTDGKVLKFLGGSGDTVVYLARTVHARQSVQLMVGVGGGDQLNVWLNGRKIASAQTCLTSGRYGCSTRVDGTRIDQVLMNLELQTGDNVLLVQLTPGSEPSFYFSPSPNPVPRLWEQVRQDFPPGQNPLLELVHADWFGAQGWFTAPDSQWEVQLIERLVDDCGADEKSIGTQLNQLRQAKAGRDAPGWLDLCVKCSVLATVRRDLTGLRAAVTELGRSPTGEYPVAEFLEQLDEFERRLTAQTAMRLDPGQERTRRLMAKMPQMQHEMLVQANPLLRNTEILFVKRYTYNSKHYYDDFQHITRWGGNLCVLSPTDGRVREIAPQLTGGIFDRYDLSFDATRVLFGYRRPHPEGFRIYEMGLDGRGLRQVTHPPVDEDKRIAMYGQTSTGDSFYGSMGYRFWTDDVHPCYLSDGGICFASTRSEHGVLCTPAHYLACTNLFRMDADGDGLRAISQGALSEFTPTMMEDGRILYNRWEYVYKGIAAVQPLWVMRPDGSGSEEFYGDNIANPGVFWQARQVPGHPHLAVCTGCGHEPLGVGQLLLLNRKKSKRTPAPMISLTPNVKTQNLRGLYQLRNGVWREDIYGPFYADPYPLSDKFFLVSCNPAGRYNDQAAYGIHLLDTFGNRVPIYDDPKISCWQPMPLRPRKTPPVLPGRNEIELTSMQQPVVPSRTKTAPSPVPEAMATVFLSDVYRGLEDVEPGTVKYLRVMEQIPKPWASEVDLSRAEDRAADGFGGHIAVSWNSHIWIAVLRGIVPVEEDGSAYFEVPANRNLFFQALDKDFMEVQRMRTFVNFEPNETRSCIGCHEHRRQAPVSRRATAFGLPPAKLAAQPGEVAPRPLDYPRDVQPILDQHCVRCHDGGVQQDSSKPPKAAPDLRNELTDMFSRSYESILQGGLVNTIREWNGGTYAMQNAEAVAPYTYGSHSSKLVQLLKQGHYDANLSNEEWIKLVTWIDCGAPYYGSYYGRRHLRYRGQPDFRPVPTLSSACGIPPKPPKLFLPDPLPAQLLAWWPLDESAPDVADDASGHGHEAKIVGAASSEGLGGHRARRFDGRAYIESGGLGSHEALSIALWIKADSLNNSWNPLLFCHDGQRGAVHFSLLSDGTPNVAVNSGDWNWTHRKAGTALSRGKWHHVALVCDARLGGSAQFYVDGRPVKRQRLGLGQQLDLYRFRLGAWNRWETTPANNFHGEIADVRIYSGMLTDSEVTELAGNLSDKQYTASGEE